MNDYKIIKRSSEASNRNFGFDYYAILFMIAIEGDPLASGFNSKMELRHGGTRRIFAGTLITRALR